MVDGGGKEKVIMTMIAATMILIMFVMQMVLVVLFIGSPLVSLVPDLLTHGLWCP